MNFIPFTSIPAVKIGHLAVDKKYKEIYSGIGSLMIELARGICVEMRNRGIACRFITLDADIENNPTVCDFYFKNDFKLNENYSKRKNPSLGLDIDRDTDEINLENLA